MEVKIEDDKDMEYFPMRADRKGKVGGRPIQAILQEATGQLGLAGIENPRLEAEVLLAHVLKVSRIELFTRWDEEVPESVSREFQALLARRARREPLAYLIGAREFWSLNFLVNRDVLIPRPETEFVIEAALRYVQGAARIIDVGTGSGNIAICLAKELPKVHIYAVDISWAALVVARQNAAYHRVASRITFLQSDLVSAFAPRFSSKLIDCLVSNPPYISSAEIATLAPEISVFEPRLALDGGSDGLDCLRRLIGEGKGVLKAGGRVILEMGCGQREALVREFQDQGYEVEEIVADYAGIDRVIVARLDS